MNWSIVIGSVINKTPAQNLLAFKPRASTLNIQSLNHSATAILIVYWVYYCISGSFSLIVYKLNDLYNKIQ